MVERCIYLSYEVYYNMVWRLINESLGLVLAS